MNKEIEKQKQEKAGNPLFVLIIFIALIGFVFLIPEIYRRFNTDFASFLGIGSNKEENKKEEHQDNTLGQSAFYQIGSNPTFKYNEIEVSGVSLNSNILKMTLASSEQLDLKDKDYYIEFYENQTTFLGRRILKGNIKDSLTLDIDVTGLNITTVTYFTLSHISIDTIPNIELPTDESNLTSLTCTQDNTSYTYEFDAKKLRKIVSKYTGVYTNIDELSQELLTYQKREKEYNELNGVTASIANLNNSFIFTAEFDYAEIKNFNRIEDEHLFMKDTLDKTIKFQMEAEGYDCK